MISSIRNRSRLIDKWLKVIDNSAALFIEIFPVLL